MGVTTPKVIELAEEIKAIGHATGYDTGFAAGFKAGVTVREDEVDDSRIYKKLLAFHVAAQGGKLEIDLGAWGKRAPAIIFEHPVHIDDHIRDNEILVDSDFDKRTVVVRTVEK